MTAGARTNRQMYLKITPYKLIATLKKNENLKMPFVEPTLPPFRAMSLHYVNYILRQTDTLCDFGLNKAGFAESFRQQINISGT